METTVKGCPLCNSYRYRRLHKFRGVHKHKSYASDDFIAFCLNCNLVYRPRIIPDEWTKDGYSNVSLRLKEEDFLKRVSNQLEIRKERKRWIEGYINAEPSGRAMLDVGGKDCGFAKLFEDSGWKAVAIDPLEEYVHMARRLLKLNVVLGYYKPDSFPQNSLDIIIAHGVMYRIDPMETFLEAVRRQLKPEGILYIGCPDVYSLHPSQFDDQLRVYFSEHTLKDYMENAGFEIIASKLEREFNNLLLLAKYSGRRREKSFRCIDRFSDLQAAFIASDFRLLPEMSNYFKKKIFAQALRIVYLWFGEFAAKVFRSLINAGYKYFYKGFKPKNRFGIFRW